MYIFNLEKANGLTASYGVDVEVIDKTAPVIVIDTPELVFFENSKANEKPYSRDMIDKAFEAYDMFEAMIDAIQDDVVRYIYHVNVITQAAEDHLAGSEEHGAEEV